MTPAQTILIADSNDELLNILEEELATTNYALLHATSGEEAIAFLEQLKSRIELAIIDLELPDVDGWDLIGRLTLHDRKPTRIIATTSIRSKVLLKKMKELGVDAVIRKPVPHEDLRATLQTVLAETKSARCGG